MNLGTSATVRLIEGVHLIQVSLYWRRSSNKNFLSLLIFTVSALLCKFKVKMAYKLF